MAVNLSKYNSSNFADIQDCIKHAKGNKFNISNISMKVNFQDKFEMYDSSILSDYDTLIFSDLLKLEITEQFFYRPEYVSYYLYQTVDLWYLILYVNRMTSFHEFTKNIIYIPSESTILLVNQIIEKEKMKLRLNNQSPPVIDDLTLKRF